MARCCGNVCACKLTAGGTHLTITGTGTQQDPFVLSSEYALGVVDSSSIDLTLTGLGTVASPWSLTAAFNSTSTLDQLGNVVVPSPTTGQVLSWNGTNWVNAAPTTAASGAVLHNASMTGDGSAGFQLNVQHDPVGGLETGAAGEKLTAASINQLVRGFTDATARAAASPVPDMNTLSMLDSVPGVTDYWNGSTWLPLTKIKAIVSASQLLNLSGAYDGRTLTLMVKQLSVTTDAGGAFTVLSTADLVGYAGVLSCVVQETGGAPWTAVLYSGGGQITGTAYRLDTGAIYPSVAVTGLAVAYLY